MSDEAEKLREENEKMRQRYDFVLQENVGLKNTIKELITRIAEMEERLKENQK